jgi:hypothetical protein
MVDIIGILNLEWEINFSTGEIPPVPIQTSGFRVNYGYIFVPGPVFVEIVS